MKKGKISKRVKKVLEIAKAVADLNVSNEISKESIFKEAMEVYKEEKRAKDYIH